MHTLEDLTRIFTEAGAKDPESWANSQYNEGINQLGRFSFLKCITSEWLQENQFDWIDNHISSNSDNFGNPCSQLGRALSEMILKGVSKESIIGLIRVIQYETLHHVCSTIDLSIDIQTPVSEWGLFEIDKNNTPTSAINGLHESLLEFDPSGNEMRPRGI
jgi:hypothetical protein